MSNGTTAELVEEILTTLRQKLGREPNKVDALMFLHWFNDRLIEEMPNLTEDDVAFLRNMQKQYEAQLAETPAHE